MNSDDDNHEEEGAVNDAEEIKMESMEEPESETFTQGVIKDEFEHVPIYSGQQYCGECNKYISAENYNRHVKDVHKKVRKKKSRKSCPHCGKEFSMSNLNRHIKQVHMMETEACPVCGKGITKGNLTKHVRNVHKVSVQKARGSHMYTPKTDRDRKNMELLRDECELDMASPSSSSKSGSGAKRKRIDEIFDDHEKYDNDSKSIEISKEAVDGRTSGRKKKPNPKYNPELEKLVDYQLEAEIDHPIYTDEDIELEDDKAMQEVSDLDFLPDISRPQLESENQYNLPTGYRIVNMSLMRTALKASQRCGHAAITIAETGGDSAAHEDLATMLAFVCTECGTQTVFANSAFSDSRPSNYSLNKTLLPVLGQSGYLALSQVVQNVENSQQLNVDYTSDTLDTELVMSTDHEHKMGGNYNGDRKGRLAFDDEGGHRNENDVSDYQENGHDGTPENQDNEQSVVCEPNLEDILIKEEPCNSDDDDISNGVTGQEESSVNVLKFRSMSELTAPSKNDVGDDPLESEMKPTAVFPVPGGMLTAIPSGTKISSSNVTHTSTSKTGFPAGVYQFTSMIDGSQSIVIIKKDEPAPRRRANTKTLVLEDKPYPAWKRKGHQKGGKKCAAPSASSAIARAGTTRKTPLEFFSREVKDKVRAKNPHLTDDEVTNMIIDMWIKMSDEKKALYKKMVLNPDEARPQTVGHEIDVLVP